MEKKTWKMELAQKTKEVESLEANAKCANSCHAVIAQQAEQYLSERNDLELEVTDLVTQVILYVDYTSNSCFVIVLQILTFEHHHDCLLWLHL